MNTNQSAEIRKSQLLALGEQFADFGGRTICLDALLHNRSFEETRDRVRHAYERAHALPGFEALGLTRKEIRRYDAGRLISAVATGDFAGAGLELEVGRAISLEYGTDSPEPTLPFSAVFARDFNIGGVNQAGNLTSSPVVGPITAAARPAFALGQLGAMVASGFRGGEKIPRFGSAIVVAPLTEVQGGTQQNPTTEGVAVTPRRIAAWLPISRQALVQAAPVAIAALGIECERALIEQVQKSAINGSGDPDAVGVRNWGGSGTLPSVPVAGNCLGRTYSVWRAAPRMPRRDRLAIWSTVRPRNGARQRPGSPAVPRTYGTIRARPARSTVIGRRSVTFCRRI
jgi:hypothetical protein